ncbi:MAG: transglycosylase SLT domain-containing protein [Patescibacteria group bacterium]
MAGFKKYSFPYSNLKAFFLLLLILITLLPKVTLAQSSNASINDITQFFDSGASGFLLWQYSGDKLSPFHNDRYSFFRGDPICAQLKQLKSQYPDKFLGVNIHSLAQYNDSVIYDHLNYLSSQCGTNVIRIWGSPDRGTPSRFKTVLDIANQNNIKLILVLADYSNGTSGILPSSIHSNPTSWYSNDYKSGYLSHVTSMVGTIGNHPALYAYELANEPHCNGISACPSVYNQWANDVAATIKSINSSVRVGIGQMASQDTTFGDSPGNGTPSDFSKSNQSSSINITSGHYYNQSEKSNNFSALSQSQALGKPFYIGEASLTSYVDYLSTCNLTSIHNFPPVIVESVNYTPPTNTAINLENKHPNNVPNKIDDGNSQICYKNITITEHHSLTIFGQILDTFRRIFDRVSTEVIEDDENMTNLSTRKAQLHWSKEFPVEINAPKEIKDRSFKSFDSDGIGSAFRSTSYQKQTSEKESRLTNAVEYINNNTAYSGTTIDEQVAWGCGTDCYSINCEKPEGLSCRPVTLTEIHAARSGTLGSYTPSINNGVAFTPLSSDCYEKIFQLLDLTDNGSFNTKQVIVDDSETKDDKTRYQAIPMAAVYTNKEAQKLIPYQKESVEGDVCQTTVNSLGEEQPKDKPNSLSFFNILKKLGGNAKEVVEIITEETLGKIINVTVQGDVTKEIYFPNEYVEGVKVDDTGLAYFIPQNDGQQIKSTSFSSAPESDDTVHLGYRNEQLRDTFTSFLYPQSWHDKLGTVDSFQRPGYEGAFPHIPGEVGEGVYQWCELINKYARENGLEPSLIAAIITIESGGNPSAISYQGAVGLMQVMPRDNPKGYNFMCPNGPCFADRPTTAQLLDPEFNIQYGTALLARLIRYWGSIEGGIYHYGPAGHSTYTGMVLGIQSNNPDTCNN